MEKQPLYTIGYGRRNPEEFLRLLKTYGIEYLIDVRSKPYSRFNPGFSQKKLKDFLEQNGIRYVFMGDSLGGRPEDPTCYDTRGDVNYEVMQDKEFFREGIQRLKTAYAKELNVAIMCSESKPAECHRTRLIGSVLVKEEVKVQHIDEHGMLKDQATMDLYT